MSNDHLASLIKGLVAGLGSLAQSSSTGNTHDNSPPCASSVSSGELLFDFEYGKAVQAFETTLAESNRIAEALLKSSPTADEDPAQAIAHLYTLFHVLVKLLAVTQMRLNEQDRSLLKLAELMERIMKAR